jgi:hypothetical protein
MYIERLQGAFPNFMLAEFLRKNRILPNILNSAAFFNNSSVIFTFLFTYSLALQPCDRLTALQTPTLLYSPVTDWQPYRRRRLLCSIYCLLFPSFHLRLPKIPFNFFPTTAVFTFLFSFPPVYSQSSSYLLFRGPFLLSPTSSFPVCICIRCSIPICILWSQFIITSYSPHSVLYHRSLYPP